MRYSRFTPSLRVGRVSAQNRHLNEVRNDASIIRIRGGKEVREIEFQNVLETRQVDVKCKAVDPPTDIDSRTWIQPIAPHPSRSRRIGLSSAILPTSPASYRVPPTPTPSLRPPPPPVSRTPIRTLASHPPIVVGIRGRYSTHPPACMSSSGRVLVVVELAGQRGESVADVRRRSSRLRDLPNPVWRRMVRRGSAP
jgi:hypothetical protein